MHGDEWGFLCSIREGLICWSPFWVSKSFLSVKAQPSAFIVLNSVKPMTNYRWCCCKILLCLSWNAAHIGSSGFASVLKGHLSAVLVEAAWDALIRILMTKLDWRKTQDGQNQTGILHIKTPKLVWVSLSLESQGSTRLRAWLNVPTLFCVFSRGGKTCKIKEKPILTFWVSPLPFFFLLRSNVENLKIWGNAENALYVKYSIQNKT